MEKGLVIMTEGEGEEGEKVRLKNCLDGELNPGLQRLGGSKKLKNTK